MDVKIGRSLTKSAKAQSNSDKNIDDGEYVKFKFNCMKRVGNDSAD